MAGQTMILSNDFVRQRAMRMIETAPHRAVVNIRAESRSLAQNDKMQAMLTDISRAKPQGRIHTTEVWKALFMNMAGFTCTFEPSLDGKGVVPMGFKSSRLSKAEFSDLIECIYAFGAEYGVEWTDPAERQAA